MKKNTMMNLNAIATSTEAMTAIQNLFPDMDVASTFAEVAAEWNKNREKSEANARVYAAAEKPVFAVLDSTPRTVKEIFAEAEADLPEGFSPNKIQWALLNLWSDKIVVTDNGKNPKTYSLR